ncbi:MAG: single-stranded DNA-binding protein [Bacteroidia bacterium]|nr:single-stranded DNA-binding protein [Bacteroidia bacterium]MDW8235658.1 single-stranded DNA-binding protein [Bacteroidia bacterium]
MYLRLIAAGRLSRDAELRQMSSGKIIRFSIPHTQRLSGEEKTQWIECSYWRNPEDSTEVMKLLKKGALVVVEGTPSVRTYIRQDNTAGVAFECRVSQLRVLSSPSSTPSGETSSAESEESPPAETEPEPVTPPSLEEEGDLPF